MVEMLGIFIEGILLGLVLSITLGPAFFTIIQTSIDRGFKSAFLIAIGVATSDLFIISISYLGLSAVIESGKNQIYAGIVGGVILVMYGVYTFFKKPEILKRRSSRNTGVARETKPITFLAKGFFLNIANPFIILFWLTIIGYISQIAEYGKLEETATVFLSGTILTVFSMDVLKSFIGYKIKKYLRPRIQLLINRIVGFSLVVFGIILIIRLLV
jgi:threonine/homoserine/homoserine lactone efflux protein